MTSLDRFIANGERTTASGKTVASSAVAAIQSTWSCILAMTGSYERLLNYVVFADWIFFGLTVGTVLVFRRRLTQAEHAADSYRAPGYPVVQILFVITSAAVVLSVVRNDPASAGRGAALLALGIPVFFWFRSRSSIERTATAKRY